MVEYQHKYLMKLNLAFVALSNQFTIAGSRIDGYRLGFPQRAPQARGGNTPEATKASAL